VSEGNWRKAALPTLDSLSPLACADYTQTHPPHALHMQPCWTSSSSHSEVCYDWPIRPHQNFPFPRGDVDPSWYMVPLWPTHIYSSDWEMIDSDIFAQFTRVSSAQTDRQTHRPCYVQHWTASTHSVQVI